MTARHVNDVKHWRKRAAQMRALADWMKDAETQRMMLKLANDYDKLADRAESRAPKPPEQRPPLR